MPFREISLLVDPLSLVTLEYFNIFVIIRLNGWEDKVLHDSLVFPFLQTKCPAVLNKQNVMRITL